MSVLGVGLRASSKKPSLVAILDPDSQLTRLESFYEDIELTKLVKQERPALVAIEPTFWALLSGPSVRMPVFVSR